MEFDGKQSPEIVYASSLAGTPEKLRRLRNELLKKFEGYASLLEECNSDPVAADAAMVEKGICTEAELLNIYAGIFEVEAPEFK